MDEPTIELQEEWVRQHGVYYQSEIEDNIFYWRPLGRSEIKAILLSEEDQYKQEELICITATLWPEEYDFINCELGAVPSVLSQEIMKMSYFNEQDRQQMLQEFIEDMGYFENQIDVIIHEVFPEHTIDEIQHWPYEKAYFYVSRAIWVIENLRGMPLVALDQQEEPLQQIKLGDYTVAELKAKYPGIPWEEDESLKRQIQMHKQNSAARIDEKAASRIGELQEKLNKLQQQ